jgi:hypothetical protein
MKACPICGSPIEPDEKLVAELIPERDWWVVRHIRPTRDGDDQDHLRVGDHSLPEWHVRCARAGFRLGYADL